MTFEYWFLLPLGVVVASLSMSSGISGSNFWIPIYLLWLGLEARLAFWASLLTMLFGFGSGVIRNLQARTWNSFLVWRYLRIAGPTCLLSAVLSAFLDTAWLLTAFALFALLYGGFLVGGFLRSYSRPRVENDTGESFRQGKIYPTFALLAGALQGTIATGCGTLLLPVLLKHKKIKHHAEAVGSTVILVFLCSLLSMVFRVDSALLDVLVERWRQIASMMLFVAPGVVIGGQLGPLAAQRLPRHYLRVYVGSLLLLVGLLVGLRSLSP